MAVTASASTTYYHLNWTFPLPGYFPISHDYGVYSSTYGWHYGLDLAPSAGTSIYYARSGTVIQSFYNLDQEHFGNGHFVAVRTADIVGGGNNNFITYHYAHMLNPPVNASGQYIVQLNRVLEDNNIKNYYNMQRIESELALVSTK